MKQIYYKTESRLDNIIIEKTLNILGWHNPIIPLLENYFGKDGILRRENWEKCMNLLNDPSALLILLMDIDNDHPCVSQFLESIEIKYGKRHQKENCHIFLSIREIEMWLMADIDGFSRYFGVPKNLVERIFHSSEYDINNPKEVMKNIIRTNGKAEFKRIIDDSRYFLTVQGDYMRTSWNPNNARRNSKSYNRMIEKIEAAIG